MSTTTFECILSAADFVRSNWSTNPEAVSAFVDRLRAGADELAATAVTDDDRRKAAAVRRQSAAAEETLAELEVVSA